MNPDLHSYIQTLMNSYIQTLNSATRFDVFGGFLDSLSRLGLVDKHLNIRRDEDLPSDDFITAFFIDPANFTRFLYSSWDDLDRIIQLTFPGPVLTGRDIMTDLMRRLLNAPGLDEDFIEEIAPLSCHSQEDLNKSKTSMVDHATQLEVYEGFPPGLHIQTRVRMSLCAFKNVRL